MKNILIALVIIVVLAAGGWFLFFNKPMPAPEAPAQEATSTEQATEGTMTEQSPVASIGVSAGGRDINAYHFGSGDTEILFVGGIHGGYEWNTSVVAYQLIAYLTANPDAIPANETVTVIPALNPDGLKKAGVEGVFTAADIDTSADLTAARFNGNNVDLNRNFDCDWQASGVWQTKTVSGGTSAFSEPESQAIHGYIQTHVPAAVVVWFSSAGGVYSSNCHAGVLPETTALTNLFAKASGYPAHESFDYYATTGDMTNWLAKIGIPAISVLLTNHTDTEWSKNQKGVSAVLAHFAN